MVVKTIVFIIAIIGLLVLNSYSRGFTYGYLQYLYSTTKNYEYLYLPQIVAGIINVAVFIILFDIYYGLFKTNLISSHKKWAFYIFINYGFLLLFILLIIFSYRYFLVKHVLVSTSSPETRLNSLNVIYSLIIFFSGLVYIAVASTEYLLLNLEKRLVIGFNKLINILWANKGSFILWIFMGYFIAGAIGFTGEAISSLLMLTRGFSIFASQSLVIAINAAVIFIFYKYFVENYIMDILFFIKCKQYL